MTIRRRTGSSRPVTWPRRVRTTPGSTPDCLRPRSRAPVGSPSRPRCIPRGRTTSITCCARPTGEVCIGSRSPTPSTSRTCGSASVADRRIGGATRVVAVLGWPIEHSLSPVIHNAAFDAMDLDWVYVALPVAPGPIPEAVAGLVALGVAGANITMPHKEAVADAVDQLTEDAERLRAVNTIEIAAGHTV